MSSETLGHGKHTADRSYFIPCLHLKWTRPTILVIWAVQARKGLPGNVLLSRQRRAAGDGGHAAAAAAVLRPGSARRRCRSTDGPVGAPAPASGVSRQDVKCVPSPQPASANPDVIQECTTFTPTTSLLLFSKYPFAQAALLQDDSGISTFEFLNSGTVSRLKAHLVGTRPGRFRGQALVVSRFA